MQSKKDAHATIVYGYKSDTLPEVKKGTSDFTYIKYHTSKKR